jgi:hypothetical protein
METPITPSKEIQTNFMSKGQQTLGTKNRAFFTVVTL